MHALCVTVPDPKLAARLKQAREQAGYKSAMSAARAIGVPEPTYLAHENASRGVPREAAKRYARFFRVSLDWLVNGSGEARRKTVAVVGYVGAGAEIHPIDDYPAGQGMEQVDPPPGETGVVAARIRGSSMHPFGENWLVFWRRDVDGVPEECLGKLCVVQVKNGPTMVKVLRRGSRKGRFTLESWNGPAREDEALEWASRVIDIRPV